MTLLSRRVRNELRRYEEDLLRRTRLAPCPVCGAVPEQWCINTTGARPSWLPVRWTHGARRDAAKRSGHVRGRRLNKL